MKNRKTVFKITSRKSQITYIRRSPPSTGVKALVAFAVVAVVVVVAVVGQVVVAGFVVAVVDVVDVAATLGSESRRKSESKIFLIVFKV